MRKSGTLAVASNRRRNHNCFEAVIIAYVTVRASARLPSLIGISKIGV